MTKAPEGAQLSEDGQYWWDGSQWQPNTEDGTAETSPEAGEITSARALTPEQVMFAHTMLGTEGDDEQPVPDMDPETESA